MPVKPWYREDVKKKGRVWSSLEASLSLEKEWGVETDSSDSGLSEADKGHWNDLVDQWGYTETELELAVESEGAEVLEEFNTYHTQSSMVKKEVGNVGQLRLR